jgi:hypothetical protein
MKCANSCKRISACASAVFPLIPVPSPAETLGLKNPPRELIRIPTQLGERLVPPAPWIALTHGALSKSATPIIGAPQDQEIHPATGQQHHRDSHPHSLATQGNSPTRGPVVTMRATYVGYSEYTRPHCLATCWRRLWSMLALCRSVIRRLANPGCCMAAVPDEKDPTYR